MSIMEKMKHIRGEIIKVVVKEHNALDDELSDGINDAIVLAALSETYIGVCHKCGKDPICVLISYINDVKRRGVNVCKDL